MGGGLGLDVKRWVSILPVLCDAGQAPSPLRVAHLSSSNKVRPLECRPHEESCFVHCCISNARQCLAHNICSINTCSGAIRPVSLSMNYGSETHPTQVLCSKKEAGVSQ